MLDAARMFNAARLGRLKERQGAKGRGQAQKRDQRQNRKGNCASVARTRLEHRYHQGITVPHKYTFVWLALALVGCAQRPSEKTTFELHVAAATNLSEVLPELNHAFTGDSGIRVISSFGATAQLAQQIENGGPFDVFLAADTEHVDALLKKGLVEPKAFYARGELVIWTLARTDIHSIEDLARVDVRGIAVAKPELAPYGRAAVEAMKSANLWASLQSKVVYAQNISGTRTYVETGNCDAAFTALSLVIHKPGQYLRVDPSRYLPIDQALCVSVRSKNLRIARRYAKFLLGMDARPIWQSYGYALPGR